MSSTFERRRLRWAFILVAAAATALLLKGPLFGEPPATTNTSAPAFQSSSEFHSIPTGNPPPAAQWIQTISPTIEADALSDRQVNEAIHHGVDFLTAHFDDGRLSLKDHPEMPRAWREGLDALCVYALLRAGLVTTDDRLSVRGPLLSRMLERLDSAEMETDLNGKWGPVTYARGLRAMALAVHNRPEDRDTLKDDAAWLVGTEVLGGYFYDDRYAQGRGRLSDLPESPTTRDSPKPRLARPNDIDMPMTVKPDPSNKPKPVPPTNVHVLKLNPPSVVQIMILPPPVIQRLPPPPPPTRVSLPPRTTIPPSRPNSKPGVPTNVPSRTNLPAPTLRLMPSDSNPPLKPEQVPWDNSNSQYGMLGVLACAEAGIEIPSWYWKDVEFHWLKWQMADGGWAYRSTDQASTLAMTAAGVTALYGSADWTGPGSATGREPYLVNMEAGIRWLEHGHNSVAVGAAGSRFISYDLFNVQRAGLMTGFKYFGKHNWYRELAADVINSQWPDGSWGPPDNVSQGSEDRLIDTAYALLFLSRGQGAVLFNKLRFEGNWVNHRHDVANLTSHIGRELERAVNWQVVDLDRDWTDWLDSPVLYIAGNQAPKLTDDDYNKLRKFAESGGLLFTHADGASPGFNKWVEQLAKKLWPAYALLSLPDDHELYSVQAKLAGRGHIKLQGVSNGSRLLLVHSPMDLAGAWQSRAEKSQKADFELGTNISAYATGKDDPKNRLDSRFLPATTQPAKRTVKIARLKYGGTWDPEPLAWTRLSRWLQQQNGTAVECANVDITALRPGDAPIAHLTGTGRPALSAAEGAALRAFVEAGGVLLIDSCGGRDDFTQSIRQTLLASAFADVKFAPLATGDPLLNASAEAGMADLSHPRYRTFVLSKASAAPAVTPIEHAAAGKGHVYFSHADITSGLLGTRAWGINGFDPDYASGLVKNLILRIAK